MGTLRTAQTSGWRDESETGYAGCGQSASRPGRPCMNIIGGIVYRDPAQAGELILVRSLLPGANDSDQARRIDLAGAVLAGVGAGVVSDHSGAGALVADVDLTNLEDLPGITDGVAPARCLQQLHAQFGIDFT